MARPPRHTARDGAAGTGSRGGGGLPPLAEAKLSAPRLRAETVRRPRLVGALDAGEGTALTLVSAPPGYGKTTAVRAWCATREGALAWVTLDEGDNDPVRLWTYVAAAVDRVRDGLGRSALQRLRSGDGSVEGAVDELTNGIAAFGEEVAIVLDELQAVTDGSCLASLEHALEHLPSRARIVAITRADPALRLARLRAGGTLAELRTGELAFTTSEAHELLVERGQLQLSATEVEVLCSRTEGWPAALVLAALWLRSVDDPGRAVRDFGGDQRFVAEYLSDEVLGSLDDEARSFLLRASVLGRFTPELCDGVLGRTDSAAVLAQLERSNQLVVRLEHGGWFRIHSLFAEFARLQLAAADPGATEEIHRNAAAWLRARGLAAEAAEHAAAAGDDGLMAELLVEHHLALIRAGAARTLLRWIRTLPDEQLLRYPELAGAAAAATTMIGPSALERRRYLSLASRAQRERPERFGTYAEAVAEMVLAVSVDRHVGQAVAAGRRAVELAEAGADDALVAALAGAARALYFAGELDEAWAAGIRALEHPEAGRRPPGHALARTTVALVAADRGRLDAARAHAERAKAIVGRIGSGRSWLGANASAALGVVLAAEENLPGAERELASAEHFFRDEVPTVHHAWLLALLARVRCRRGRLDEADGTLRRACEAIDDLEDPGSVRSLAADVALELELARARAGSGELLDPPSQAELAVLRFLASDLSVRQIGAELFLSPNTVRSHTRSLYRKLGVGSRVEAVARADALGMLGQTESPM